MEPARRGTNHWIINIRQLIHRSGEENRHCLRVKPDWTIERVKRAIAKNFFIPVEQQRLLFQHKRLQDRMTLEECGLRNNATIQLVSNRVNLVARAEGAFPFREPDSMNFINLVLPDAPWMPVGQSTAPEFQPANLHISAFLPVKGIIERGV